MRQRTLDAGVAMIVLELFLRFQAGSPHDNSSAKKNKDIGGIASMCRGPDPDVTNHHSRVRLVRPVHEHAFSVPGGEFPTTRGRSRLIRHRRSLR